MFTRLKKIRDSRIGRNSIFSVLDQILTLGLGFFLSILFGQYLGVEKLGQYSTGQALVGIIGIFTNFGIVSVMAREIAKSSAKTTLYLGNAVGIKLLLSFPLLIAFSYSMSLILGYESDIIYIILLLAVYNTLISLIGYYGTAQRSLHRNELVLKINLVNKSLTFILALVLLTLGYDLEALLWAFIAVAAASVFYAFYQMKLIVEDFRLSFNWRFNKRYIYVAFPLIMAAAAEFINLRVDSVIITSLLGDTEAGIYGAAYNFFMAATILPVALSKVYFPNFVDFLRNEKGRAFNLYEKYLKYFLWYSVLVGLAYIMLADFIVNISYGSDFNAAADILMYLAPCILVIVLNRLTNYSLVALKQNRYYFKITVIGTVFNIAGNYLFISALGLKGAAISTFITEFVILVLGIVKIVSIRKTLNA